jgi:hypothetical protein
MAEFGSVDPVKYMERENEVDRHIGTIVRLTSEMEIGVTDLLAHLVNPTNPTQVRPLVDGRRLPELIDMLARLLPDYGDRKAFTSAMRRALKYRDALAHSTRHFEYAEWDNYDVQWLSQQRRRERTTMRVERQEARSLESEHRLLLLALETLLIRMIFHEGAFVPLETMRDEFVAEGQARPNSLWGDALVLAGFDAMLSQ